MCIRDRASIKLMVKSIFELDNFRNLGYPEADNYFFGNLMFLNFAKDVYKRQVQNIRKIRYPRDQIRSLYFLLLKRKYPIMDKRTTEPQKKVSP